MQCNPYTNGSPSVGINGTDILRYVWKSRMHYGIVSVPHISETVSLGRTVKTWKIVPCRPTHEN